MNELQQQQQPQPIDERFAKFIAKHHVLTLATVGETGEPYVANCFYAYDRKRNLFIFTSSLATRHGSEMQSRAEVALSIVLETGVVGRIEGLQVVGRAERGDEAARKSYIRRFPYAAVADLELWMVRPTMLKLTDNTLGFGKKLIWQSME